MCLEDLDDLIDWLLHEWQHASVMQRPDRHRIADARRVLIALRESALRDDPAYEDNLANALLAWRDVFNGGLNAGLDWLESSTDGWMSRTSVQDRETGIWEAVHLEATTRRSLDDLRVSDYDDWVLDHHPAAIREEIIDAAGNVVASRVLEVNHVG
jgi:hypothetical protein